VTSLKNTGMELSIIIVTWKSLEDVRMSISSIYRNIRDLSYEVIVVDNASGDDTEHVIRTEFPGVLFVQSDSNRGFARGNNLGYTRSSGEMLLFLNPDTEITQNVFARMVAYLRGNVTAGAVGARLLNSDGTLQTSCVQAYPTIYNQLLDCDVLRRIFPQWRMWGMRALFSINEPVEVDVISGACFMVKRNVFESVGWFTETYFMYAEDLDLSYKISKSGKRIYYLPDCPVIHHGGRSSTKQVLQFANLQQRESLLHFFRTTRGTFYGNAYRAALAISAVVRMSLVCVSLLLEQVACRDRNCAAIFMKWFTTFRWAIGLESFSRSTEYKQSPDSFIAGSEVNNP
jgi:hypothetical protein